MEKYVMIPQADIDALDKARNEFYKFVEVHIKDPRTLYTAPITVPMWKITHTKYPMILVGKEE